MKKQLSLFFIALQFYTRLPIPSWVTYSQDSLSKATRFLPLIGWITGMVNGVIWFVGYYLLNVEIGLLLSMIVSVLMTGAFHEDGFADVCDGFGGGWTKEKILEIMKDSRLGTYGASGLIFMLAFKYLLLQHLATFNNIDFYTLTVVFIAGHSLSRFMAATVIFTQSYARDTEDSKAKPVAVATHRNTFVIAGVLTIIPLLALVYILQQPELLLVLPVLYVVTIRMSSYFKKWIGGYTGDCLGAVQQVTEVVFYLFLAISWKFI
ncbi:adenosylcobinamide-GDP ribazoletransferase [Dyadobacter luteus]|uniref:Adenosylcobinamide-GDP ribazoletransferase n=1 Tax=Dyadobacter luteus TaxID=2259619 RepID=A0A3D8YA82_9BACT|nr:adenosylcobinamide-GDP ribazoletransferase [Dyadobacter luteus]REA60617.1 adenosylcobinamide-GDP ribazoletransferase [Dyadobacter luteus]